MSTQQYLGTIETVNIRNIVFCTHSGIRKDEELNLFYFFVTIYAHKMYFRGTHKMYFTDDILLPSIKPSLDMRKFVEIVASCEWNLPTEYNWTTEKFEVGNLDEFNTDIESVLKEYCDHLQIPIEIPIT